jgi:hypothetical protein
MAMPWASGSVLRVAHMQWQRCICSSPTHLIRAHRAALRVTTHTSAPPVLPLAGPLHHPQRIPHNQLATLTSPSSHARRSLCSMGRYYPTSPSSPNGYTSAGVRAVPDPSVTVERIVSAQWEKVTSESQRNFSRRFFFDALAASGAIVNPTAVDVVVRQSLTAGTSQSPIPEGANDDAIPHAIIPHATLVPGAACDHPQCSVCTRHQILFDHLSVVGLAAPLLPHCILHHAARCGMVACTHGELGRMPTSDGRGLRPDSTMQHHAVYIYHLRPDPCVCHCMRQSRGCVVGAPTHLKWRGERGEEPHCTVQ